MERSPLTSVKKFSFLEYFYILLECIEIYPEKEKIFDHFKVLKQRHRLGESKYKKNFSENITLTEKMLNSYRYTFEQVIAEAKEYKLIEEFKGSLFSLTDRGNELLTVYLNKGENEANKLILILMEFRYEAFKQIIEFLYKTNEFKRGVLVLPAYSPRQLGYDKSDIKTGNDIIDYLQTLIGKFENDFQVYLGNTLEGEYSKSILSNEIPIILERLRKAGIFPDNPREKYRVDKYNAITKRIRDFWINYFLQKIYKLTYSMATFDIWCYRGKQIGIIHATEFYPNLSGRLVYPTSVVVNKADIKDFTKLHSYKSGESLLLHDPSLSDENNELFVSHLFEAYMDLRRTNRSYFISLLPVREMVCYKMKISSQLFEVFLGHAYRTHLRGELQISISLETDRLPEETKAVYLTQEPVFIEGQPKNIIGIDIFKRKN